MKKILFFAVLGALGTTLFTSCSNEDAVITDPIQKKTDYAEGFIDHFGQVAPNQTFNTVQSVTLESSMMNAKVSNYSVSVYDGLGANASLLAKFNNLDAHKVSTLKFNVSSGAKELCFIADDGQGKKLYTSTVPARNGKITAKFEDVPSDYPAAIKGTFDLKFSADYAQFTKAFYENILNVLTLPNIFTEGEAHDNVADQVLTSFTLSADEDGIVTLYPIFINENLEDEIGYYIIDSEGNQVGEDVVLFEKTVDHVNFPDDATITNYPFGEYLLTSDGQTSSPYPNFSSEAGIQLTGNQYILSKPIKINAGVGNRVGLYITNTYENNGMKGEKFYSDASKNYKEESIALYSYLTKQETETGATTETTVTTTYGVIGLEDMVDPDEEDFPYVDKDMNDIVFYTENPVSTTEPLASEASYTIAFEDLGTTDDFDFNDVVITISYVTTNEPSTATVTLECAGGVLPARVYYLQDVELQDVEQMRSGLTDHAQDLFGEVHAAFGKEPGCIINTNFTSVPSVPGFDGLTAAPVTINVPANFSISFDDLESDGYPFFIVVNDQELDGAPQIRIVQPNTDAGQIPEALVLGKIYYPQSAEPSLKTPLTWQWPKERVSIDTAYPNITTWITTDPTDLTWLTNGVNTSQLYKK